MYSCSGSSENMLNVPILTSAHLHHQSFGQDNQSPSTSNDSLSRNANRTDTDHIRRYHPNNFADNVSLQNSMINNIQTISGSHSDYPITNTLVTQPGVITTQPQAAPFGLNLTKILVDLNNIDPLRAFILNPNVAAKGTDLYEAIACQDLPVYIRELELEWKLKQIRNLLGIMCKYLNPEDRERFNNICSGFKAPEFDYKKECSVGKDLSFLLNKYGREALYKQVEIFTDCCRKAWHYHNPGHVDNPCDDDVFLPGAEACYKIIYGLVSRITSPDQPWELSICNGLYLKDTCTALGLSMKINHDTSLSAASITDTFESVFPNTGEVFSNTWSPDEIEHMNRPDCQDFLSNVFNVLCCM